MTHYTEAEVEAQAKKLIQDCPEIAFHVPHIAGTTYVKDIVRSCWDAYPHKLKPLPEFREVPQEFSDRWRERSHGANLFEHFWTALRLHFGAAPATTPPRERRVKERRNVMEIALRTARVDEKENIGRYRGSKGDRRAPERPRLTPEESAVIEAAIVEYGNLIVPPMPLVDFFGYRLWKLVKALLASRAPNLETVELPEDWIVSYPHMRATVYDDADVAAYQANFNHGIVEHRPARTVTIDPSKRGK